MYDYLFAAKALENNDSDSDEEEDDDEYCDIEGGFNFHLRHFISVQKMGNKAVVEFADYRGSELGRG